MGLHVYWQDEQKIIIRQVYDMTWTWDEYLAAFEKIHHMGSEVDYPIGLIAELGNIRSVPPNAIVYGARGIRSLPTNIILSVMITPSLLAKSLLTIILKASQLNNVQTANSVDDAQRMISEKRKAVLAARKENSA